VGGHLLRVFKYRSRAYPVSKANYSRASKCRYNGARERNAPDDVVAILE